MSSREGKWVWGATEENFYNTLYDSKEAAILAGMDDYAIGGGGYFFVGQVEEINFDLDVYTDGVLERIADNVYGEVGEVAIDYLNDVTQEQFTDLETRLNDVINSWMIRHGKEPDYYRVINIERYIG